MQIVRGNTRSHSEKNSLWKRIWTLRKTEDGMHKPYLGESRFLVLVVFLMLGSVSSIFMLVMPSPVRILVVVRFRITTFLLWFLDMFHFSCITSLPIIMVVGRFVTLLTLVSFFVIVTSLCSMTPSCFVTFADVLCFCWMMAVSTLLGAWCLVPIYSQTQSMTAKIIEYLSCRQMYSIFGLETWRKETVCETKHRGENNIKFILKKQNAWSWAGFVCLWVRDQWWGCVKTAINNFHLNNEFCISYAYLLT